DRGGLARAARELERYDWLVVASARAVAALAEALGGAPLPAALRTAAVGAKTKAALEAAGAVAPLTAEVAGAAALLEALRGAGGWAGERGGRWWRSDPPRRRRSRGWVLRRWCRRARISNRWRSSRAACSRVAARGRSIAATPPALAEDRKARSEPREKRSPALRYPALRPHTAAGKEPRRDRVLSPRAAAAPHARPA